MLLGSCFFLNIYLFLIFRHEEDAHADLVHTLKVLIWTGADYLFSQRESHKLFSPSELQPRDSQTAGFIHIHFSKHLWTPWDRVSSLKKFAKPLPSAVRASCSQRQYHWFDSAHTDKKNDLQAVHFRKSLRCCYCCWKHLRYEWILISSVISLFCAGEHM